MIEISYPTIAIRSILLVALGYLLNIFISHLLSKDRTKQDRLISLRNKAGIKFKETFIKEIDFLKSEEKPTSSIRGTAYDILSRALDKHRIAYESFRLHLVGKEQIGFDEAWDKYLYPDGIKGAGPLIYYAEGDETNQRKEAHLYISKLLEFAKPL